MHLNKSKTVILLCKPPTSKMKVSEHVHERTQQTVMMVMVFLKYTMEQDTNKSHFNDIGITKKKHDRADGRYDARHVKSWPAIQQLHQYNWSSGHKKDLEGRLAILSMSFWFGGKSGKELSDTDLSEDAVGDNDVTAMMYESIAEGCPAG